MTMTATTVLQRIVKWFPGPTGRTLIEVFTDILADIATNTAAFAANAISFATASLTLGAGTPLTKAVVYSQTITPASVGAATVAEQTFTVTGLTTADKVLVNLFPTGNATGIAGVRVSATNTLAISYVNPTAGALTPAAGTYNIVAIRS